MQVYILAWLHEMGEWCGFAALAILAQLNEIKIV